jgi:NDP-sugar pyrophosphorylase family protein
MGDLTARVPKAFIEVAGLTLYERQCQALRPYVDAVTVVLGYRHETVRERFEPSRTIVVDGWDEYDNAESLYRALEQVADDDVLVLNGDVVVTPRAVQRVRRHHRTAGANVVAYLPGEQEEHTAIRLDEEGRVTDYGMVRGYRHAGLGIIDSGYADAAAAHLRKNRTDWYPSVYEALPTEGVAIDPEDHLEINRPRDQRRAEERLPLG